MFGWPHKDIAEECEALGKMGWMGVKVFPPNEGVFSYEWTDQGELNPWYWYYQPVSYNLNGRGGSREELRDMIETCRSHGVRVYADAVVNHMTGGGNDMLNHRNGSGYCATWSAKDSTGSLYDKPSWYSTHNWTYEYNENTGEIPGLEYPSAAYNTMDFHCERSLNSWNDPFQLNNGWLSGLADLDTESDYVRERIAAYMTDLISIGFSGYRIDAAKHIQPDSLAAILAKVKRNLGGGDLPSDFMTYLEVLIGGEAQLLECDYNSYEYSQYFDDAMAGAGLSESDISKVKIWSSDYPKEMPICGYWIIPSERFAIENDCHDDQVNGSSSRDMQDKGSVLIKEKNVPKHRGFEELLFNRTDANWKIRLVLSSYSYSADGALGIPDGHSDCSQCVGEHCGDCHKTMPYSKAHDPNVCGYTCEVDGQWQDGVYTRVHRDMAIIQAMRNWQGLPYIDNPVDLGLPSQCRVESTSSQEFLQ
jgi:alpha-amylase